MLTVRRVAETVAAEMGNGWKVSDQNPTNTGYAQLINPSGESVNFYSLEDSTSMLVTLLELRRRDKGRPGT
jgi:hypothetical protein